MASSTSVAFRPKSGVVRLNKAQAAERAERSVHRRVRITWWLLLFNTITFYPHTSLIPIPSVVGKGIAQGVLPVALLVALSINPKAVVRPNVFLGLVSLLVVGTILTTLQPEHFGTIYRTARLAGFVAGLWLLTPWWGRRDLLLVRAHLSGLWVLIGSVLLGLAISPHRARAAGRLTGVIWPILWTQIAHYAALAAGLSVVLWFCGYMRGRTTLIAFVVGGSTLLLSHTRTALAALVAGLLVAGLSLIAGKARVRKLFAAAGAVAAVAVMTLSAYITTWLSRGQGTHSLDTLSGRTQIWGPLLAAPRDKFQEIFGFGLSNGSFNSFPIDSNWLASYEEQGLFGMVICALILLFLLVAAYFQPRGVRRALALFLVTYCLVASFTEVGFTDASPYLLDLTLAASLLVPFPERNGLTELP
jgi:O-antigen ligase/polysaccharide polymerase Wzy-like membrane protein